MTNWVEIVVVALAALAVGEYFHSREDRIRREHMTDLRRQIPGYYKDRVHVDEFGRTIMERPQRRDIVTQSHFDELQRTGHTAGRVQKG